MSSSVEVAASQNCTQAELDEISKGELEWCENSHVMFEEICNKAPWFIRNMARWGITMGLKAKGCGKVTEDILYEVCQQCVPKQFLPHVIEILDKHKTVATVE